MPVIRKKGCDYSVSNYENAYSSDVNGCHFHVDQYDVALKPVFVLLFIGGLDLLKPAEVSCCRWLAGTILRFLFFGISASITAHNLWIMSGRLYFNEDDADVETTADRKNVAIVSQQLTSLLEVIQVMIVYVIVLARCRQIRKFYRDLKDVCRYILGPKESYYRATWWLVRISCALLAVLYIVCIAAAVVVDIEHPNQITLVEHFRSSEVPIFHFVFLRMVTMIPSALHFLFVFQYLITCCFLRATFRRLREGTMTSSPVEVALLHRVTSPRAVGVSSFIYRHRMLSDVVRRMNLLFREITAIWNFMEVLIIIFILRAMNFKDGPNHQYPQSLLGIVDVIGLVLVSSTFLAKSIAAHFINNEVISSLTAIMDIDENTIKGCGTTNRQCSVHTTIVKLKCQMYAEHMNVDPPKLTGWGLYTIRKGFVLAAAGNILTYVLVLYNIREAPTLASASVHGNSTSSD